MPIMEHFYQKLFGEYLITYRKPFLDTTISLFVVINCLPELDNDTQLQQPFFGNNEGFLDLGSANEPVPSLFV